MNLSSYNNGGIQGVFLLFKNVFNIDQEDLVMGLAMGSDTEAATGGVL